MSIKFTILGSGSSVGVPRIDGYFGNCDPKDIRNYRTRCSAAISYKDKNILIDTSPDLRAQLLKNKIKNVECVFYTRVRREQVLFFHNYDVMLKRPSVRQHLVCWWGGYLFLLQYLG